MVLSILKITSTSKRSADEHQLIDHLQKYLHSPNRQYRTALGHPFQLRFLFTPRPFVPLMPGKRLGLSNSLSSPTLQKRTCMRCQKKCHCRRAANGVALLSIIIDGVHQWNKLSSTNKANSTTPTAFSLAPIHPLALFASSVLVLRSGTTP